MFPGGGVATSFVEFCIILAQVPGLSFVKVSMKLNVVRNFEEK